MQFHCTTSVTSYSWNDFIKNPIIVQYRERKFEFPKMARRNFILPKLVSASDVDVAVHIPNFTFHKLKFKYVSVSDILFYPRSLFISVSRGMLIENLIKITKFV